MNERYFFRATRQVLGSLKVCDHFALLDFGKLELFVKPDFKDPIIISQKVKELQGRDRTVIVDSLK